MKCPSVAIAVLFLSIVTQAQSVQHIDSPFSGVTAGGCSEEVALSGMIHGIFDIRVSKDGDVVAFTQAGPRGDAQAIGMTTGKQYNVAGHTFQRIQIADNLQQSTYVNQFKVVGLLTVHYDYRVVFIGDFENRWDLKAVIDKFRVTCD